jgi:hypothetical protein
MPKIRNFNMMSISALVLSMVFPVSVLAVPKKSVTNPPPANPPEIIINMPSKPKPLVDTAVIRKLYLDGEFEPAIEILETGLTEKRPFNHVDSVFIFKHLGVMYAAKYETRERGKYFMHQLLMTEPTARIMDMYASDMIYMIFKNIQDEFDQTRGRLSRAEDHVRGNAQSDGDPALQGGAGQPAKASKGHALIWAGATTAIVAAGVAAYFILSDEPKTTTRVASFE